MLDDIFIYCALIKLILARDDNAKIHMQNVTDNSVEIAPSIIFFLCCAAFAVVVGVIKMYTCRGNENLSESNVVQPDDDLLMELHARNDEDPIQTLKPIYVAPYVHY